MAHKLLDGKRVEFTVAEETAQAAKATKRDEDRIDEVFPKTDSARVIFEAFFELINEVRALKSQPALTRAQVRNWFKNKLEN